MDRKNLRNHAPWAVAASLLAGGLIGWYLIETVNAGHWLRGGSLPGLVCGIVAGSIIAFEMLLWPRKFLRAWRLVAAKHWLAAHLWFGLASLPLAYVHCGFHTGGLLPTLFLVLFTLTIISGLMGWCLQHIIPKLILKNVPAETVCSQIPKVSQQNVENALSLLVSVVGPPAGELYETDAKKTDKPNSTNVTESQSFEYRSSKPSTVVLGAVRTNGRIRGRTLRTANISIDPKHAQQLWQVYRKIESYLKLGRRSGSEMADALRANAFFAAARSQCGSSCDELIDALEQYCDERRQFDLQSKLNAWLHNWLPIHIGLSVAVTVLLVGHIFTALRY
ncbi:MAG: hypothetical protein IT423_13985 [Pirellulaceae bacterium]|nr:hypothetical protein [Pirellulaceae bacterium]